MFVYSLCRPIAFVYSLSRPIMFVYFARLNEAAAYTRGGSYTHGSQTLDIERRGSKQCIVKAAEPVEMK